MRPSQIPEAGRVPKPSRPPSRTRSSPRRNANPAGGHAVSATRQPHPIQPIKSRAIVSPAEVIGQDAARMTRPVGRRDALQRRRAVAVRLSLLPCGCKDPLACDLRGRCPTRPVVSVERGWAEALDHLDRAGLSARWVLQARGT